MKKQSFLEKVGNYFIFKGNLSPIGFMIAVIFAEGFYNLFYDGIIIGRLSMISSRPWMQLLLCYLMGIAIVARLRNLKLNPAIAYFFVMTLFILRYLVLNVCNVAPVGVLYLFVIMPLLVFDKKYLLFWKEEHNG